MRVVPVGSVNGSELQLQDSGSAGARSGDRGSAGRVVLSAAAHRALSQDAEASQILPFSVHGARAAVALGPGSTPGFVHVSVRVGTLSPGPVAPEAPAVTLEAEVRQTWLRTVTNGAATQEEQADRIARAIAGLATIPGQGVVGFGTGGPAAIRGPVRPQWPQVWLPAEYPPPPDDPALLAALRR